MTEGYAPGSYLTGYKRDESVTVGTKLSDKWEGTPIAVVVGFMSDSGLALTSVEDILSSAGKTPIAKVYSQAAGNKQFDFSTISGSKKTAISYNFNPVSRGLGRYLTLDEIKNGVFSKDLNKAEGRWLNYHLARSGNLSATPIEQRLDIEDQEALTDVAFFDKSQLFVPYLDKLYVPELNRYSKETEENKNTSCLLSTSEVIRNLPAYVAHLSRKDPPQGIRLSEKDLLRMNVCVQDVSQGALYKIGTGIISALVAELGAPPLATYGILQIIPAIGPMVYHVESENYNAVLYYFLQIAVDIWGAGIPGFNFESLLSIIADVVFSIVLAQVSSPSAKSQIEALIKSKNINTLEDAISVQREINSAQSSDFQGFADLVPAL